MDESPEWGRLWPTAELTERLGRRNLEALLREGNLVRVTRGTYVRAEALAGRKVTERERRHRLETRALLNAFDGRAAASHHSGALLHGLALWGVGLASVHLTRMDDNRASVRAGLVQHQRCPGHSVVEAFGVPVLGVADCVVGVGLGAPWSGQAGTAALIAADSALHRGLTTSDEVADAVARRRGFRGIGPVRAALVHADGRHESPAETRTAVVLRSMKLSFVPQFPVSVDGSNYSADFKLTDHAVLIEVDGLGKYGDPNELTPEAISEALKKEKRREDALRSLGYVVVRVTWEDLRNEYGVAARVRAGIALAHKLGLPPQP